MPCDVRGPQALHAFISAHHDLAVVAPCWEHTPCVRVPLTLTRRSARIVHLPRVHAHRERMSHHEREREHTLILTVHSESHHEHITSTPSPQPAMHAASPGAYPGHTHELTKSAHAHSKRARAPTTRARAAAVHLVSREAPCDHETPPAPNNVCPQAPWRAGPRRPLPLPLLPPTPAPHPCPPWQ